MDLYWGPPLSMAAGGGVHDLRRDQYEARETLATVVAFESTCNFICRYVLKLSPLQPHI